MDRELDPLTPKIGTGLKGYRVSFRDPHKPGRIVSARLGTRDPDRAKAICLDLDRFRAHPDPESIPRAEIVLRQARAVVVYFGQDSKQAQWVEDLAPAEPTAGETDAEQMFRAVLAKLNLTDRQRKALMDTLKAYVRLAVEERDAELRDLRTKVRVREPELEDLRRKVRDLESQQNKHVRTAVNVAVETWIGEYKASEKTRREAAAKLRAFADYMVLHGKRRLGDIEGADISAWLAQLKTKPNVNRRAQPVTAVTRRNFRANLSIFYRWARRRYRMTEDPLEHADPVTGVSRRPEQVIAIRRIADLEHMLKALEPHPYWRAVVAVACLAGPRYAELAWLRVEDVYLDNGYLRITSRTGGRGVTGTKTGRERTVPIERTVLLQVLKDHVADRIAARKRRGASKAESSPWLFPSTVDEGPKRRTKSEPGQWSDNGVFLNAWEEVAKACRTQRRKPWSKAAYWAYGPREWRHCAGVAMGHSGVSTLRISDWLGNSEDIARRHYIGHVGGEHWPFEYGANG